MSDVGKASTSILSMTIKFFKILICQRSLGIGEGL